MTDDYTAFPKKVRITSEGDETYPWVIDGYDPDSGDYTEDVWSFETWEQARSAIGPFVDYTRTHGVTWPWDVRPRTVDLGRVIDTARDLLSDGSNPEYDRALVELLSDLIPAPHDRARLIARHALGLEP